MGFAVEAQEDEELPEKLFGAVRICQMEMSSATFVDTDTATNRPLIQTAHSNRVQASDLQDDDDDDDANINIEK